jgi:ATP-binding cassette subfamily C protein
MSVIYMLIREVNKQSNGLVLKLIFISTLISIAEILSVAFIFPAIELSKKDYISNYFNFLEINNHFSVAVFLFLFVFTIRTLLVVSLNFKFGSLIAELNNHFSMRIFNVYISKEYSQFSKISHAEFQRNLTGEVTGLINFTQNYCNFITEVIVSSALLTGVMLFSFYQSTFLVLIIGLSAIVIYAFTKRRVDSLGLTRQKLDLSRINTFTRIYNQYKEIQHYSMETKIRGSYQLTMEQLSEISRKLFYYNNIPRFIIEYIALLVVILLVINTNENAVGYALTIIFSAFRIIPSLNRILQSRNNVDLSRESCNLIIDHLINRCIPVNWNMEKFQLIKEIRFNDINFKYIDKYILENRSFQIKTNSITFIKGVSGSGKTTLLEILCGFLKPTSGEILLDGCSANIFYNKNWFSIISYINQQPYLFQGSIRENITLNKIFDQKLYAIVLEVTGLTQILTKLADGDKTMVGDGFSHLSGGQRQRVAISRGLYHAKKILVLDESTNALDFNSELDIYRNIIANFPKLTIVSVAHSNIADILNADTIQI